MTDRKGSCNMRIYADNAATTKMSKTAVEAMLPWLAEHYGNPSSLHSVGQQAAEALADARQRIADQLGCLPHSDSRCSHSS